MTERVPGQVPEENPTIEQRKRGIKELTRFLDRALNEIPLATPEDRLELIQRLDGEKFYSLMKRVNGVLRQLPVKSERRGILPGITMTMGGANVEIFRDWVSPHEEDKIPILDKVVKSVQKENRLDDAAIRLPKSIVLTHPFLDGNGRSARGLKYIIEHGYDPTQAEHLLEWVSDRANVVDANLGAIYQSYFNDVVKKGCPELGRFENVPLVLSELAYPDSTVEAAERLVQQGLSEEAIGTLRQMSHDPFTSGFAIAAWAHHDKRHFGDYERFLAQPPMMRGEDGQPVPLDEEKTHWLDFGVDGALLPTLQEEDVMKIGQAYWDVKQDMVERELGLRQG